MKKSAILGALLAVLLTVPVFAAGSAKWGTYSGYNVVKVMVNGKEVSADVPAVNLNGRTMVPLRAVTEAFGAKVDWDQDTYTASVHAALTVPPVSGQTSLLCGTIAWEGQELKGVTADTWPDVKTRLEAYFYVLNHFPDDDPDAQWAEKWAQVAALQIAMYDLMFSPSSDPHASAKLKTASGMLAEIADQFTTLESEYAAAHGGKNPCGQDPHNYDDYWNSVP